MTRWIIPLLLATAAVSACQAAPRAIERATPASEPSRQEPMTRSLEPVGPLPSNGPAGDGRGELPSELLERIRADASARTGAALGDLELVTAESVTWRDGSLGCPQPGAMYTMALVPGYHVVLRAGEEELDYRATASGDFRLCEDPAPRGRDPSP